MENLPNLDESIQESFIEKTAKTIKEELESIIGLTLNLLQ